MTHPTLPSAEISCWPETTGRRPLKRESGAFAARSHVQLSALFPHALHVEGERLLGVAHGFVERLAFGMQAGQFGRVRVVTAVRIRFEHELDLIGLHAPDRTGIRDARRT